ncbi:MAG TPA: S53 family peptidase [Planctomycetota bacterium]|nr:S53 family peptidase [Planctomycetota bacterium]
MRERIAIPSLLLAAAAAGFVLAGRAGSAPHPASLAKKSARPLLRVKPALALAGTSGYTPNQVRHAYGFDQVSGQGAGQIIAVVDAFGSPTLQSDFQTFCNKYSLPNGSGTLTVAYSTGQPPTSQDAGWGYESTMDCEWAHAIAPQAQILLVVTPSDFLNDLLAGVQFATNYRDPATGHTVQQVSMSWGGTEFSGEAGFDSYFTTSGVSFFSAAGDSGAGAQWPAASPYVVGVGGTTLQLDPLGGVLSEKAWSQGGGGPSTYEPEPAFQNGVQNSGKREVPDVSYDADPNTGFAVYCSTAYNGIVGWSIGGGTSAGVPQWAALAAIVNGQRSTPLSQTADAIYAAPPASSFRDITSGSNGGFSAGTGYDEVTGLGSPLAQGLIPSLVGSTNPPPPPPPPPGSPPPPPPPSPSPSPLPPASFSGGGGHHGGCELAPGSAPASSVAFLALVFLVVSLRKRD